MKEPDQKLRSPLIETKLMPPRHQRQRLVPRPRLLSLFSASRFRKLTLLQAPAGFGKTTLLSRWRQDLLVKGLNVGWFAIDADDNNFTQFLLYMIEAMRVSDPRNFQSTHVLLRAGPSIPQKAIIATLINEMGRVDTPTIIILDDYHLITEKSIHVSLDDLISNLPVQMHIVVSGRSEPPLQIAKLRAINQLVEIKASDLRFTIDESHMFFNDVAGLKLTGKEVKKMYHFTEGWAAAIQLASISLLSHKNRTQLIESFSGNLRTIREYLIADVLEKQPEPLIDFMLKTSILSRMNPDLCNEVVGITDSSNLLSLLEKNNLFIQPIDEEGWWYRYHQLFANVLQTRLEQLGPEMISLLHQTAAKWFAKNGLSVEAVKHALIAGDIKQATKLVEGCALHLCWTGQFFTIFNWREKIPPAYLVTCRNFKLALGWAFTMTSQYREAEAILDSLEASLPVIKSKEDQIAHNETMIIRGACTGIFRMDFIRAEAIARPLLRLSFDVSPWLVGDICNVLTHAYLHLGNFIKAREVQMEAQKFVKYNRGFTTALYGKAFLGMVAAAEGNLDVAELKYKEALKLAKISGGQSSVAAAVPMALLYDLHYERNEMAAAADLMNLLHDLIDIGCLIDAIVACYLPHSFFLFLSEDSDQAFFLLNRLEDYGNQQESRWLLAAVLNQKVRIFLALGKRQHAINLVAISSKINRRWERSQEEKDMLSEELEKTAEARVLMATGKPEQAIKIFDGLLVDARAFGFTRRAITLTGLLALAHQQQRNQTHAFDYLSQALSMAAPQNMIRSFVDEGKPMEALLRFFWEYATGDACEKYLIPYIDRILAVFDSKLPLNKKNVQGILNDPIKSQHAIGIEPLSTREMEILQILSKGLSNREIAGTMSLSIETVKFHLKNLFAKLDVSNRTQAIDEARILGLLD